MLDSMRALSTGIVSKILMGLLVLSFALWGVGDILREGGPSYAAKVGGEVISVADFQRQGAALSRQLQNMGMQNVNAATMNVTIMRQLVQQKLNLLAMHDIGLFVDEGLLAKTVMTLPQFHDGEGKFSGAIFTDRLKRENVSENVFAQQLKNDIAAKFLADSLNMDDTTAPVSVLALEAMGRGETRDAVLLTIPARDALDASNTAALKEFYEQNKESLYLQPESRALEYVVLQPSEINTLIEAAISKEMLDAAKARNPNATPTQLREQLRKEKRDEIMHTLSNTIEDELAAGKKLSEALVKAGITSTPRSLDKVTETLVKTSGDDITKTVSQQGLGMSEGEISGLISTKSGALLMVAVKAISPATPKPYDEVKADVRQRLSRQLARDAARGKAQSVKEALVKSPNWQAVAADFKLTSRVLSRIQRPLEGNATTAGLPLTLQQAIFERAVGQVAGPLMLDNDDHVVALVTQSYLPTAPSANGASSKDNARTTKKLVQDIENRAYQSFAKDHPVIINPAMMRTKADAQP